MLHWHARAASFYCKPTSSNSFSKPTTKLLSSYMASSGDVQKLRGCWLASWRPKRKVLITSMGSIREQVLGRSMSNTGYWTLTDYIFPILKQPGSMGAYPPCNKLHPIRSKRLE